MTAILEEHISEILRKIPTVTNLQDWSYTRVKFQSIAQNYFGIIIPILIRGTREGKEVRIQLVLKLAPTDKRFRVSGAVTVMFAREIYVYSVLLKKFHEIQKLFPLHSQYIIPHCYYVQREYCKEAIVLQDMCGEGYKPYTHEMFFDYDHIIISLKALSRLHALCFILKKENSELYDEVSKTCVPLTEHSNTKYMDIMKDRLNKALLNFQNTEYIPLLEKLRHNCARYFDEAVNLVKNTCVCHGDMWKENILFKYEEGKPSSACMIDYQTTRLCSPAFDTMYLIISSTDTELRQKYFQDFLDTYYQTFDKTLEIVGLESQEVYSRQMFDDDLKVVSPACLITANTALWLLNGLQEEGHVRSKQVWSTIEEKQKALNKYKGIVKAMVDDMCRQGFLSLKNI